LKPHASLTGKPFCNNKTAEIDLRFPFRFLAFSFAEGLFPRACCRFLLLSKLINTCRCSA
jgi:hypothetical protein